MKETIICSAIYINDGQVHIDQPTNINEGYIISGRRHNNCYAAVLSIYKTIFGEEGKKRMEEMFKTVNHKQRDQGFITSLNRYVDRKEGMVIAKRENQLLNSALHEGLEDRLLTSEDLFPCNWEDFSY